MIENILLLGYKIACKIKIKDYTLIARYKQTALNSR